MEEDIVEIIKDNAGTVLEDMVLLNPKKLSQVLTNNMRDFISWKRSVGEEWEYYTTEQLYKYWKTNIRK